MDQISAQPPEQRLPSVDTSHPPGNPQEPCTTCLTLPLPSKWICYSIFSLMSAQCNLRLHSPLKTVFNKLGDTYQVYCDTYKTHAMATCHRGPGQPLDRDATPNGPDTDVDIQNNYHHEDTGDFETHRTGESHQPSKPYLGTRWFMPQSSGQRGSTSGSPTLHRTGTPKAINSPLPISTTRTS